VPRLIAGRSFVTLHRVTRFHAALALVLFATPFMANGQDIRLAAGRDTALRIVVSLSERRLRVMDGPHDTLLVARVAVGSDREMSYSEHRWQFNTPRGVRTVVAKDSAPVWMPPDWHYVEVARREQLKIVWIRADTTIV
jgi:hypothetical protein